MTGQDKEPGVEVAHPAPAGSAPEMLLEKPQLVLASQLSDREARQDPGTAKGSGESSARLSCSRKDLRLAATVLRFNVRLYHFLGKYILFL